MARKGQSIEILSGWQEGLGGEDFLRELVAHRAAGFGSGDDQLSGRGELPAQRCSAGLAQRFQAAHLEDARGRVGTDGAQGPRRAVSDRAVRALSAQRKGVCTGLIADVCRGRFHAQGERDYRSALRPGSEQEPSLGADREAGRGGQRVAYAAAHRSVSVPDLRRAL